MSKLAETQFAEGQKHLNEAVEQLAKNASAGSKSAVAMLKSSLASASTAYDSLSKAEKQAADVAESNLTAAANSSLKATTDVAGATKSARRARRLT